MTFDSFSDEFSSHIFARKRDFDPDFYDIIMNYNYGMEDVLLCLGRMTMLAEIAATGAIESR